MRSILHIVSESTEPEFAAQIIQRQKMDPALAVELVELSENPNYRELLKKIFAAESVQVW